MTAPLPPIVAHAEWDAARRELLAEEKALTRARDRLAARRRRMPMVRVDPGHRFLGPEGEVGIVDPFAGRRQLIVYRFFMDPGMTMGEYPERGCPGCSMYADQVSELAHLEARDTRFVAVSRGPQDVLHAYRERMGWSFPWYTLLDDFDVRHDVGEWHGTNAFLRDGDDVYRTYFVDGRGDEALGSVWSLLDLTAYGRQEEWEDSPPGWPQTPPYAWWRYHDRYDAAPGAGPPDA